MVTLDQEQFYSKSKLLLNLFKNEFNNSIDSLVFAVGSADDNNTYSKTTCLQTWLLGYEFPDTIMCFTQDSIYFLSSPKKCSILESLLPPPSSSNIILKIFPKSDDSSYSKLLSLLGSKIGVITKDSYSGAFITKWNSLISSLATVDVAAHVATLLSIKQDHELKTIKQAAKISSLVLTNYFVEEMQSIIDNETSISHQKLSTNVENRITDDNERLKMKFPSDLTLDLMDWCYPPIIQSGGKYDLRPSATSNTDKLHDGTLICSLGARYKSFCSNIARTYLVNPEPEKEENYKFLTELQDYVLAYLKPDISCSSVYAKAISYIEKKKPELKDFFLKNCGFGMGLEFRESLYVLGPKCNRIIKSGMVFNLCLGFQNLEIPSQKDPKCRVYSLLLADTIQILPDSATVLTFADKDLVSISYAMGDDDDDQKESDIEEITSDQENIKAPKQVKTESKKKSNIPSESKRTAILDSRRRDDQTKTTDEEKRREHQKNLAALKQKEGLARFSSGEDVGKTVERTVFKKFESYRKESQLPSSIMDLKIHLDKRTDSVILPIYGQPVPFHLNTIKNVTKSDEQDCTLLRFNFISPGVTIGRKEANTPYEDANATFIRNLSFKSTEQYRMNELCRDINDLKKELQKRESEKKQLADLVEQDNLIEIKGRRPLRLPEVFVRPTLEGKRRPGDLEIHTNGLRFSTQLKSDQKLDILFSNIQHLFFQPCDSELVVLLHVHLKNPIMIGKKKTKDVQFFREVTDASFDETGNRRRRVNYGDEDELAAEQEERKRRLHLNKEFQLFSEKVSEASKGKCDVDVPFRELGFQGVPGRQLVLLQPTTDCLVQLTEVPFLVVTLSDVEVAHLERVQFGLKNFDLVFVFKDYKRPVVHINTIPSNQIENVKDWLDSVDICYSEGPVNLSWPQIMKTVNDDTAEFFREGGWSFLQADEGDEEDEEEEESEFEADSEDLHSASETDDDSVDSAVSESDDGSDSDASGSFGGESGSEGSEGEDWDELERKAAQSDAKKRAREGDEIVVQHKKKR